MRVEPQLFPDKELWKAVWFLLTIFCASAFVGKVTLSHNHGF
jgi:hypothetical protein